MIFNTLLLSKLNRWYCETPFVPTMNARCVSEFHHMNTNWIFGLYHEDCSCTYFRMFLDQIFFEICLGTHAWFDKVELSLQNHALGDLVSFVQYQLPYVSNSCWIRLDLAFRFAFYVPTTVLFMSEKAWCSIELSELRRLQNVPFVSLRMICKTPIWCNQILIVKHLWSALWKTFRMIFLMEYS